MILLAQTGSLRFSLPNDLGGWLEIVILWGAIYVALRFLRGTRGFGFFRGLLVFMVATIVGVNLLDALIEVPRLKEIVQMVGPWIVLVMVILFQQEIRHGIARLGRTGLLGLLSQEEEGEETISKVAAAARRMAKERTGAIIAFERTDSLAHYRENAVRIDAPVSTILLESIFFHGNPLHDGGVILKGGSIMAAAAIFPLTENQELQRRMGTRHRAALGITEETDAVALVVSEETGQISLAAGGKLYKKVPLDKVEDYLGQLLRRGWRKKPQEKEQETAEPKVVDSVEITEASKEEKPGKTEEAAA